MQVLSFQSYNILVGTLISAQWLKKKKRLVVTARCDSTRGGFCGSQPGSFSAGQDNAQPSAFPTSSLAFKARHPARPAFSGWTGNIRGWGCLFLRRSFWVVPDSEISELWASIIARPTTNP